MTVERLLHHLTTVDVAALPKDRGVVVQPIGAVEQHGPHLPVVTDALVAERIARGAVARLPDDAPVWVLPTLHYGKSTEHLGRAGTVSLSTRTLLSVCEDVGRSVAASGFRRLVFVNGHGGNPSTLDTVARDVRVETGLQVFPVTTGRLGLPADLDLPDAEFSVHGGHVETSLLLALEPSLVRLDRAVEGGRAVADLYRDKRHLSLEGVVPTAWVTDDLSANGVIGDPVHASAEVGHRVREAWESRLAQALLEIVGFEFPGTV
ncbi:creatininase family protein [Kineococcus sp. NPDC059986]|uniref:creatininase family protein n=1 Tax=Kineococcus sp. NPDC059986 TaxID=3155538 RepID=UPI00344F4710